jgi:predicted secreted protein
MTKQGTIAFMVMAFAGVILMFILYVAYATSGPVVVLESDNGGTATITTSDTLQVSLSGNPTTGYNWFTTDVDSAVLAQTGDPTFDPDSNLLGSPGVITLEFDPITAGTTQLTLEYRPVAGGAVGNTFTFAVIVE